ncbi:hypothetical protein NLI96_g3355 [Meripilus lineatus]|uniref:Glucose-methanol-choline oxidoreductase N-terminal domain-containing protein n=1 Tax=Meripilus lineatus TaxID=2056292 RepID=A0AAD5YJ54_9APHY|nr:hypothetical protein NLI96_g3355 [Physisporinus lineatus]
MLSNMCEAARFTSFDYLIVGGGSAGLTVAARLSEDPNVTVGVLEAGCYVSDMPQINVPGYVGQTIGHPDVDWMFSSTPQPKLGGRTVFQSRATSAEYDAFETLGNPGWNWTEFLKYLKKASSRLVYHLPTKIEFREQSETLTSPPSSDCDKYHIKPEDGTHGRDGPVAKTFPRWITELHVPFFTTLESLGVPINPDPQNGNVVGSYTSAYSIHPETVTRSYAATAYYEPNVQRPNFDVLLSAQANRINLENTPNGVKATGVSFTCNGETYVVNAHREVILCAGAFQTPQLLELSGIGRPDILKRNGIDVLVELPGVGENLEVKGDTPTFEVLADPEVLKEQMELYTAEKRGMLSSVHSGFAMLPLAMFTDKKTVKTMIEKIESSRSALEQTMGHKRLEFLRKWFDDPNHVQLEFANCPVWMPIGNGEKPAPGSRYHSIALSVMHPFSRGSVHIASSDPTKPPEINPNYLESDIDVELLVHGVKFARKFMLTSPFSQYHLKFVQPIGEIDTDDEIKSWILQAGESSLYTLGIDSLQVSLHVSAGTFSHPLGTASMLPQEDGGVVGPDLIVHGTCNLRVVDASIIPFQLATHPQATIYAIAEKAADIIKGVRS